MKAAALGLSTTLLMVRLPLACFAVHSFTFRSFAVRSFTFVLLPCSFAVHSLAFFHSSFVCSFAVHLIAVRSLAVRSCSFAVCSCSFAFVAARAFVRCLFFRPVRSPHSLAVYSFFFVRSPFIRSPFVRSRSFMFVRRSFVFVRCSSPCSFAARVFVCCSFIAALSSCGRAVGVALLFARLAQRAPHIMHSWHNCSKSRTKIHMVMGCSKIFSYF